jgi:hypothetical protein
MSLTQVSYSLINGIPLNVLDYGADPTGVADSAPAIQAAINAGATLKKDVRIPAGVYKCNAKLTITTNFQTLRGDGCQTVLWGNHSGYVLETGRVITDPETVGIDVSGMYLWSPTGLGMNIQNTNKSRFSDLWAWSSGVGFTIQELSIINTFTNLTFSSNLYGFMQALYPILPAVASLSSGIFINRVTVECNALTFINALVEGSGSDGVLITGTHVVITFINLTSEGCNGWGMNVSGITGYNGNLTLVNAYFEANSAGSFRAQKQAHMNLLGGQYAQSVGGNVFFFEVVSSYVSNISCYNFTEDSASVGNIYSLVSTNGNFARNGFLATLTPNSATPTIRPPANFGGLGWKTNNSSATVYTNFLGGYAGLTIQVFIRDANTTVDFTGSNLKGNSGVDWVPANGDWMDCTYDGTNWYCTINKAV